MELRAAPQLSDDINMLRNPHCSQNAIGIGTHFDERFAHRHNPRGFAYPAQECLIPDAHAHDVHPAESEVLSPSERCFAFKECAAGAHVNGEHLTEVSFGDEPFYRVIHS